RSRSAFLPRIDRAMCQSTSRIVRLSSPTRRGGRSGRRGRSSRTSRAGSKSTARRCRALSSEGTDDVSTVIVTGSGGLIGSESVAHFVEAGHDVIGIENDMRARFFGPGASTAPQTQRLLERYDTFRSLDVEIRDAERIDRLFARHAREL